jgi:transposase-like protein
MTKKRQRRSADFKFRVALAALKEQQTLSQLAGEYEVRGASDSDYAVEEAAPGGGQHSIWAAAGPRSTGPDRPRSRTL